MIWSAWSRSSYESAGSEVTYTSTGSRHAHWFSIREDAIVIPVANILPMTMYMSAPSSYTRRER